jgi:hypothetical protein
MPVARKVWQQIRSDAMPAARARRFTIRRISMKPRSSWNHAQASTDYFGKPKPQARLAFNNTLGPLSLSFGACNTHSPGTASMRHLIDFFRKHDRDISNAQDVDDHVYRHRCRPSSRPGTT